MPIAAILLLLWAFYVWDDNDCSKKPKTGWDQPPCEGIKDILNCTCDCETIDNIVPIRVYDLVRVDYQG